MPAAVLPESEEERLALLREFEILDTEAEELFDSIPKLASAICSVPIALVSLVDKERQWFKAKVGIDAEETHRDLAFCAHAILEPEEVLVVEDATKDPRFMDNPLVTGDPKIRFYAGAPIVSDEGLSMGTVCVIDQKPRQISEEQKETLRQLARQVYANLELKRRAREIDAKAKQLYQVVEQKNALNKKLKDALEEAKAAMVAKSQFLSVMSHEIRTPMNGLIGALDLMSDGLPDELTDHYEVARGSAGTLLHLINDVLDFSKIEAGKLNLERTEFDLIDEMDAVVQLYASEAKQKGLQLNFSPDSKSALRVYSDVHRLKQVVSNLIGNAIKFTAEGSVGLGIHSSRSGGDFRICITVEDTGIGIPSDRIEGLFHPFEQLDTSTTRRFGGTGLGLSICRSIVEHMGGEISVRSKVGEGSLFTVKLPLEIAKDPSRYSFPIVKSEERLWVLLDDQDNWELFLPWFDLWGFRVKLLREFEKLPRGLGVNDRILVAKNRVKDLPKEILTEHVQNLIYYGSDEGAGVSGVVSVDRIQEVRLPVSFRTLYRVLARKSRESAREGRERTDFIRLEGKSVLLVDDDKVNQLVVSKLLTRNHGIEPEIASDGREALEMIRKGDYDIIFMDCMMPEMDGYETTRTIRRGEAGENNKEVLIFALTANASKEDREQCAAAGMDEHLPKPIDSTVLNGALAQRFTYT